MPYGRPLCKGEIRLLEIKPGYAMNTIECEFSYVKIQAGEDYVALSYTWGQAAPSVPILVNGTLTTVTDNLYLALLYLRKGEIRKVWVDALCINQGNLAERSIQVSQMDRIYRSASMVYVWLGESNELTERAFAELYDMTQHIGWDNIIPAEYFDTNLMHSKWRAISEILYRPWFRRVWVIQELLCARHALFVCGKDFLEASNFLTIISSMSAANVLREIMSFHPNKSELVDGPMNAAIRQLAFLVQALNQTVRPFTMRKFRGNTLDYLAETRYAEATDPRDKVYGILSLAKDCQNLGWHGATKQTRQLKRLPGSQTRGPWLPFTVDYALTPAQVFINVTKAIISTTRAIDILNFAGHGTSTELPSWVPDWGCQTPRLTCHNPFAPEREFKNKYGEPMWRPRKEPEWNDYSTGISNRLTEHCQAIFSFGRDDTLKIEGLEFDAITGLSEHAYPPGAEAWIEYELGIVRDVLERLELWTKECVQLTSDCDPYPTQQSLWAAFKNLLYPKVFHDDTPLPHSFQSLLTDLDKALTSLASVQKQYKVGEDEVLSHILANVASSHFISCFSRLPTPRRNPFLRSQKFATTTKKYMGLVPDNAKVGDLVCIAYGSELPLILRRCARGRFSFIGHGRFEGLHFDDVVVEKTYTLAKNKEPGREVSFSTWNNAGRTVCTILKNTKTFSLQ
ncbi:hypothetical protein SLS60_011033 [Paraconiothyrium brasiliense]|uniref:Heterokaryon incompatibility domain-containing protein n=1 Tax=Paraconiothyrium brasiliense TaxID=300254 RepID=A0ABR3QLA2_9PLEO